MTARFTLAPDYGVFDVWLDYAAFDQRREKP